MRASEFDKKGLLKEEKRAQRELMDTIRSSNDVVAQLTSRLRKAEEKLHRERENVQNLMTHSKKLEQVNPSFRTMLFVKLIIPCKNHVILLDFFHQLFLLRFIESSCRFSNQAATLSSTVEGSTLFFLNAGRQAGLL